MDICERFTVALPEADVQMVDLPYGDGRQAMELKTDTLHAFAYIQDGSLTVDYHSPDRPGYSDEFDDWFDWLGYLCRDLTEA